MCCMSNILSQGKNDYKQNFPKYAPTNCSGQLKCSTRPEGGRYLGIIYLWKMFQILQVKDTHVAAPID